MKQILKNEKNILLAILSALPAAAFVVAIFVVISLMSNANYYFDYFYYGSEIIPAAVIGFYTIIGILIAVFSKRVKAFLLYTLVMITLFWGIYYIIMILTGSSGIDQLDALFYFLPLMLIVINNGTVIVVKSMLAMHRHSHSRELSRLRIFSLLPCAAVVFCIVATIIAAACISSIEALNYYNMFFSIDMLVDPTIRSLNFLLFPVAIITIISSVAVSIINFKKANSAKELKKAYFLQTVSLTIVYLIYNVFDLAILDHTYYPYESFYYITDINFYYINIPRVCFYLIPVVLIALNLILLYNKRDKKDADLLQ